nr:hypothetical protein [Candidatus Gracilibacteria bacterium]
MNKNLDKILQEIYEMNPSLKENKDLSKLVENMLLLKPNIKVDENLKNELKNKLNKKIFELGNYEESQKATLPQILKYIFSGVFVTSVGIFALINLGYFGPLFDQGASVKQKVNTGVIVSKQSIETSKEKSNIEQIKEPEQNIKTIEKEVVPTKKEEPPKIENKQEKNIVPEQKSESPVEDTSSNDFEFPKQAYDVLFLPENVDNSGSAGVATFSDNSINGRTKTSYEMAQPSLMMDTTINSGIQDGKIKFIEKVKKLNIFSYNLGNISESNTGVLIINENKDYGMTFTIDFDNLTINISKNDSKWPKNEANTGSLQYRDEMFEISIKFLGEYNIDLSNYDRPIIEEITNDKVVLLYKSSISSVRMSIDLFEKKVIGLTGY